MSISNFLHLPDSPLLRERLAIYTWSNLDHLLACFFFGQQQYIFVALFVWWCVGVHCVYFDAKKVCICLLCSEQHQHKKAHQCPHTRAKCPIAITGGRLFFCAVFFNCRGVRQCNDWMATLDVSPLLLRFISPNLPRMAFGVYVKLRFVIGPVENY